MELQGFPYHCGTKVACDFFNTDLFIKPLKHINTLIGIFVNTPDQRKSYQKMKKRYKILYQSPILSRNGHGRDYFIVIWLNKSPKLKEI